MITTLKRATMKCLTISALWSLIVFKIIEVAVEIVFQAVVKAQIILQIYRKLISRILAASLE